MSLRLEDWIQARHLSEDGVARAAARYASDPFDTVVFDDFLLPSRLEALRRLFEGDGDFGTIFGVYDSDVDGGIGWLEAGAFAAVAEDRKFLTEKVLQGAAPDRQMSQGYLTHLKFLHFCGLSPLRELILGITGIDPVGYNAHSIRVTEAGHYVRAHDDNGFGRRFTLVLYLGRAWLQSEGGRFRQFHPNGAEGTIEPIANRMVLFRVSDASRHDVEPLAPHARPRWSYTVWLGEPYRQPA